MLRLKAKYIQSDMTSNVTIERFTNILNDENAAALSRKIYLVLSGYGCMEIDSNTLFVKVMMKENSIFKFFFAILCIKFLLRHRDAFPMSVATSNAGLVFAP